MFLRGRKLYGLEVLELPFGDPRFFSRFGRGEMTFQSLAGVFFGKNPCRIGRLRNARTHTQIGEILRVPPFAEIFALDFPGIL